MGIFPLDEVYEPLTLKSEANEATYVVDRYPTELLSEYRCVAITDDAGMGKSTVAKYIVRRAIERDRHIPIFIELRRLRAGRGILDALSIEFAGDTVETSSGKVLVDLLASGNFIFVLDGYDEVDEEIRAEIASEINDLAARFRFCYFVVTSRREYGTAIFPGFAQFEIAALTEQQAFSLIRRYDQGRGVAKSLIGKIKEAQVADFLGNPLMVTLLYRAFDYRQSIPPKRSIFFRQVYEALFQDHDLSKGDLYERKKVCGLDVDDFHRFLRALGLITLRAGRDSFSPEEFSVHLKAAVDRCALPIEWSKAKLDLVRAVPIFRKDGVEFRWAHKAFQEYFSAQYIVADLGEKRDAAVEQIFKKDEALHYREVLRFIAEADVQLVRDRCIEPLLASYFVADSSEFDAVSRLLYDSASIYYVGTTAEAREKKADRLNALLQEKLGDLSSGDFTHLSVTMAGSCTVLSMVRPFGAKVMLLAELDKEYFAKREKVSYDGLADRWLSRWGESTVVINSSLEEQRNNLPTVDDVLGVMRLAQLPQVNAAIFQAVRRARDARRAALDAGVFDGL